MRRLGNPQDSLPPVIHVAGTNGKGSVIAFLRAALEAAGYKVHVYTSPHLMRFNERIRLAGSLIGEDGLLALIEECEAANGDAPITFFELTTAVAFIAFQRHPADIVLLETGLGGRLDATNLVDRPALSILTSISHDHEFFLGTDLARIAAEKAAIIKTGRPALSAAQVPEVTGEIAARVKLVGARLLAEGRDWSVAPAKKTFRFRNGGATRDFPLPALPGRFQVGNAGLAIAALGALDGFSVTDRDIARGLKNAEWQARLQRMEDGSLSRRLPSGWELWLDGGHNAGAAAVLAEHAAQWNDKPLDAVVGMLNSKDTAAFLAPLAPHLRHVRGVAIPGEENSLPALAIVEAARAAGTKAAEAASVGGALDDLASREGPARVLICGSLYLAGQVLSENSGA
jgi:dihydrofolate synthase/folylpolyglutamate synthase